MAEEKSKEELQKELQEKFKNGIDISTFGFAPVAPTKIDDIEEKKDKE